MELEEEDEGFYTPECEEREVPILRPKPPHSTGATTARTQPIPNPSNPTFSLGPVVAKPGNMAQIKRNVAFNNDEGTTTTTTRSEQKKPAYYAVPDDAALQNCGKQLSQPLHSDNDSIFSDFSIPTETLPCFTTRRDSSTEEKMFASIGDKPEVDETDVKMPLSEPRGLQRQRKNAVRQGTGNDNFPTLVDCKRELTESFVSDMDSIYMETPYLPPPYNPSHYATIQDTSNTEEKRLISAGDKAHFDKTEVKRPLSDNSEDSFETADFETERKEPAGVNEDDSELKKAIHELQEAQRQMAILQEKHDEMLRGLLQREPSVNKHFDSVKRAGSFTGVRGETSRDVGLTCSASQPVLMSESSHIYAQIEQIYANLTRIHLPTKTVEKILGRPDTPYYNLDLDHAKDVVSPESDKKESAKLATENADLKLKIQDLEKKLKEKSQAQEPAPAQAQAQAENPRAFVPGRPTRICPPPLPQTRDLVSSEVSFKWTITNYRQKLKQEAESAKQAEISPSFYLTHGGYKARLEAYLNGNGSGHNRNMSVFLRVVRGDYDNDLKWPLVIFVTFILVDQSDNGQSLRAGRNKFEYTRPSGYDESGNDCWGLIEFVSHEQILGRRYVHEDKVALKCRIQFGNDLLGGSLDGKKP